MSGYEDINNSIGIDRDRIPSCPLCGGKEYSVVVGEEVYAIDADYESDDVYFNLARRDVSEREWLCSNCGQFVSNEVSHILTDLWSEAENANLVDWED